MSRLALMTLLCLTVPVAMARDTSAVASAVYRYLAEQGDNSHPPLRIFMSDLNDDGHDDAVVIPSGGGSCGSGGCNMLIFRGHGTGFSYVCGSTITNEPVMVLPEKAHGWHTLIVSTGGLGPVSMKFDGHRYPLNPSLQPKASSQTVQNARVLNADSVGH
jgi:hypothetical protein